LETRLPIAATDPNAAVADTHVDDDPFAEDPGVDNDEHSELPEVIKITTTNTMFTTIILLLKLNFPSLFLMARMMLMPI
jgi:hypothetical protein